MFLATLREALIMQGTSMDRPYRWNFCRLCRASRVGGAWDALPRIGKSIQQNLMVMMDYTFTTGKVQLLSLLSLWVCQDRRPLAHSEAIRVFLPNGWSYRHESEFLEEMKKGSIQSNDLDDLYSHQCPCVFLVQSRPKLAPMVSDLQCQRRLDAFRQLCEDLKLRMCYRRRA
jgi:hypothetical protein